MIINIYILQSLKSDSTKPMLSQLNSDMTNLSMQHKDNQNQHNKTVSTIQTMSASSSQNNSISCGQISIKTLSGKVIRYNMNDKSTINDLKQYIQDYEGIPKDMQRIIFLGKILDGQQKLLADYGIKNQSTLHMVLRLNGDIGIFDQYQNVICRNLLTNQTNVKYLENQTQQQQINQLITKLKGNYNSNFQICQLSEQDNQKLKQLIKLADLQYSQYNYNLPKQQLKDLKIYLVKQRLIQIIGEQLCIKLQKLFADKYDKIVIRRCQAYGKMIQFHLDNFSTKTMQISLNDDSQYVGGRLIYASKGKLQIPQRKLGTVTIHDNKIVHGVSRMESGVRYGLFFLQKQNH